MRPSGNLCIFEQSLTGIATLIELDPLAHAQDQASTFGGVLDLNAATTAGGSADGTWAVTG